MPCSCAYSSSFSREVRFHSRHGAITRMLGLERVVPELERTWSLALAGRAVRDRVRPGLAGDLDLALGDKRPGDRSSEKVFAS